MSPNSYEFAYAFVDKNGLVVQAIRGVLTQEQQGRFLADYRFLFNAEQIIEITDGTPVWIGGTYTDGKFNPPEPEPQPEPLPEPQPEPEI